MGAVFAMMPILPSALFNRNREKCPSKCGLCKKRCPAHLEIDGDTPLSGECICCHACQVTCPRKNIQIGPKIKNKTNEKKSSNEENLKKEFEKKEQVDDTTDKVQAKIDDKMSSVIADVSIKDPVKENRENTDIEYIQEVNEQRRIEAERLAEEARIRAEQEAAEQARIAEEQARIEAERQAAIRARGQAIVDAAMSKRGSPYIWGASGPNSFDCSGFVYLACKQAGVYFTRTTAAELSKMGQEVSLDELQPGDIITLNTMGYVSHVVIYIGNGQIVHAPQTGDVVKTGSLSRYSRNKIVSCRRLYN